MAQAAVQPRAMRAQAPMRLQAVQAHVVGQEPVVQGCSVQAQAQVHHQMPAGPSQEAEQAPPPVVQLIEELD